MRHPKRKALIGFLFLAGLLVGLWFFFDFFTRKPIRKELVVSYSVTDDAFRRSADALLDTPFVESNKVETLVNGDQIFASMLDAIRSATTTITLETYIWSRGKICDEFKDALLERAHAGVKVHVVVDGMGSIKLKQKDITELQDAGVRIVKFNRDKWYSVNFQINHRTHRKVMVVDGRLGFIGGSCLHDSWLGNAETENQWRDTHFKNQGPAVGELQGVFAENWRQTTGEVLHGPDYFPRLEPAGNLPVQCYKSGPKENQESIRLAILYALAASKKNIRIAHAYFVPDELLMTTLLHALERGVNVEIIVPGKTDAKLVKAASRTTWGELMAAGAKFYQYGPAMYHVKEIVIDDVLVIAGSANFDNRSFRINDEANFNVLDRAFAQQQIKLFEADKKQSKALSLVDLENRSLFTKTADSVAGVFSSQF
ncbi:MAG: cardiolipin synthase [Verrucomicrobiales bacterium]|nr:cardiolipin synthase [Verrucomicrobiales bacterium]